ncbi:energy transducer TonB [Sphingomonas sp. IW22]|uniref:energy transducer TonB n=1 Tax=Sphingomonas sp. IW22 TaxID=3242489 RepID=UPI0035212EFB
MIRLAMLLDLMLLQSKPATPPPPPVAVSSQHIASDPRLVRWMPSSIVCAGAEVNATARRPYVGLIWGDRPLTEQHFRFDIDARGRAVGIASVDASAPEAVPAWQPARDDVVPSLAASDLSGARERRDCRISYRGEAFSIESAPLPDLISYTVRPMGQRMPESGWARIRGGVDDCVREPRAPWLKHVTPDWRKVTAQPGVDDWVLLGYDLDGEGRPDKVRVVTGTQNAQVDSAAIAALHESQMVTDGPRRGCLVPYHRPAARLLAPESPETASLRPAGATCPDRADWMTPPRLTFPEPFRRRSIEGWAVVAYDVAPWGEVGNLRVLTAQPAADFGTAALNVLRAAKRKPVDGAGYTGCVERIYFKMGVSILD